MEPTHVGEAGEPAVVEGVKGEWRVDPGLLDDDFEGRTALLSPFDRLVHDRVRTQELLDFEYTLEMYKPKGQRRWGYFALPILHQDELVGKLDATADHKASVFRVHAKDPNLNVIVETVTHYGRRTIMAQRYIPAIVDGDKRVLLIGGKPVPFVLARIPKAGETRGNLAAGGTGVARELTARDREIAETLAPLLFAQGLLLVGLDVIGDYLTEVNVTSPTCFQEITEQTGFNVAGMMLDALERAVEH